MINSRSEPLDTVRKQEEYEERSRTWVFAALVLFPLSCILVVAFTLPDPDNTTHQMGDFFGKLNASETQPIEPDLMADGDSSKTSSDPSGTAKPGTQAAISTTTANAQVHRTDGSFEAWKHWLQWGIQRAKRRWLD